MGKKYTRLKLKMLLMVALGAAAAAALGLFLLEVVVDGLLQDPFARGFVWVAREVFGHTQEEALDLYQQIIRNNKPMILNCAMLVLMLAAFYLAMGRFTRWLDQIGRATRRIVNESGEEIKLPRELSPVEEDLRAIQRQLRSREAEVKENEARKRDLVAFLAHDLKTPLTSVVGYLTLLRDRPEMDGAQRAKYTGIALDKAERLEELLGEFFDITRMDLEGGADSGGTVQLTMLLEQLTDEFYPLFAEKDLECDARIAPRLTVSGDPDKLARVFNNILKNAAAYSYPDTVIEIRARQEKSIIRITFTNQGPQIPPEQLETIFEKFYRLDSARSSATGGAGLGLAIAKEIVTAHQGTISARSGEDGTVFTIDLPAVSK